MNRKLKKALVYGALLSGVIPGTSPPVVASYAQIARWLTLIHAEPTKRGQVTGLANRWPLPPQPRLDRAARAAALAPLVRVFPELAGVKAQAIASDETAARSTEVERSLYASAMREFAGGPSRTLAPDGKTEVVEIGRDGRLQNLRTVNREGLSVHADINAGHVERCEASGILGDAGSGEGHARRCRAARWLRTTVEATRFADPGNNSLDTVHGGGGSMTPTDRAVHASAQIARLHEFMRMCGVPALLPHLINVFALEHPRALEGVLDPIRLGLDTVALHLADMTERDWSERWARKAPAA